MIHRMWVLKLFAFSDEIMEQKVGQAPNVSSTFLGEKVTRISPGSIGQAPNVSSTFLGEKVTRISPGSRMDQENASK